MTYAQIQAAVKTNDVASVSAHYNTLTTAAQRINLALELLGIPDSDGVVAVLNLDQSTKQEVYDYASSSFPTAFANLCYNYRKAQDDASRRLLTFTFFSKLAKVPALHVEVLKLQVAGQQYFDIDAIPVRDELMAFTNKAPEGANIRFDKSLTVAELYNVLGNLIKADMGDYKVQRGGSNITGVSVNNAFKRVTL